LRRPCLEATLGLWLAAPFGSSLGDGQTKSQAKFQNQATFTRYTSGIVS
jgi:hypothetical protein